ncbi:hypothetical protein CLTEP_24420 [Clostridium tepidiprofundi DSM 19306]|uniref:Uncharacterized protein n=1 Tax=Clostridium tepidiprofundi DSM 19306 TaxID=1121338 RepID=A0A151ATP9_9CLOT|nr:hypothetical protein CLTEP_24420 [Clostridium tepidiprofundi DSM 19306]
MEFTEREPFAERILIGNLYEVPFGVMHRIK